MKKEFLVVALTAAMASFAAVVRNTWVDFGTIGPDKYANGAAVEAGAEYRLLFVQNGAGLEGATVCKTAKAVACTGGAHCPLTTFQYPIDSKEYSGGSFVTVLADGSVQGVTIIATKTAGSGYAGSALTAVSTELAPVAANAPAPKILSMSVKDGYVALVIQGLCAGKYEVECGTLGAGEWKPTGYGFASCVTPEQPVTVVLPVDGEGQFYRVVAE